MKKYYISVFASLILLVSCSTNPITGRKQLTMQSEAAMQQMALEEYKSFLSQSKVVSPTASKDAEMVRRVGTRLASAMTEYFTKEGKGKVFEGFQWEFNLVNNPEVNAWCMPGGKVVVYTGLLPVAQNEAALAIVLGHEIMHAVARHGNERMSQAMVAQGLGVLGNVATSRNQQVNNVFNNIYGVGAQVGVLLPNSRKQELEADHYGLIVAAMAGYNPKEAITFWQRMASQSSGEKPPEFLSTHPADETRIAQLQAYMDEALKYYKPVSSR